MKAERAVRAGKSRRMAARILIQYRRQRAGAGDRVRPEPSNDAHRKCILHKALPPRTEHSNMNPWTAFPIHGYH